MSTCPSTLTTARTYACELGADHDGVHEGGTALWWHGNGETCRTCGHLTTEPAAEPTHESEPAT